MHGVASMKSWGRALQSARKWPTSGLESIPVDRYKTDASYTLPTPPETRTTRLDLATRTDPGPAAIGVRILQILCVAQLLPYKRPHRNLHKNYTRECVCGMKLALIVCVLHNGTRSSSCQVFNLQH